MKRFPQRAPKRMVDRSHVEWHDFDPRIEEYYHANNHYTSGPGLHLPPSLPYTMRTNAVPYKLFINGIHPHTTEEGIRHIFCNYGQPLSVVRTRNKLQQPIAFVEFESQCEADNAIIALDGKPPLNWEVCYAMTRCSEERIYPQFTNLSLESDCERQTPIFQSSGIDRQPYPKRPSPVYTANESSIELARATCTNLNLIEEESLPCSVCRAQALLVCTICKTRYCSQTCQGSDWPTHQPICRPPPALEPDNQIVDVGSRATKHRGTSGKVFAAIVRDNPNIPFSHLGGGGPIAIEQNYGVSLAEVGQNHRPGSANLTSSHSNIIKGIQPLGQKRSSSQRPVDLFVTIRRDISKGSRTTTPDQRIVMDISDPPVVYDRNQPDARDSQTSDQNKPTLGTARSSNSKSSDAPSQSYVKNNIPTKVGQTAVYQYQYEDRLGMGAVPKSKGLFVSPKNLVPLVPQEPQQTHTANVAKIYATEFSSSQIQQLSDKPSRVSVCFAKSPCDIYIQYYNFREILGKLMTKIAMSVINSDPLVNPIEGQPCIAVFPDDHCWYRAQILKILPDGIGVRYVDFGNTQKMPNNPENFRMMEHSLSEYPFYAVKVKLADMFPVKGSTWDMDVCLKFIEIVENQSFLMEYVQLDSDAMSVRLKNPNGSNLVARLLQENLVRISPLQVSSEPNRHRGDGTTAPSRPQLIVQKPQICQSELPGLSSCNFAASSHVNSARTPERVHAVPIESLTQNLTAPLPSPVPIHSPTRAALRQEGTYIQPRTPTRPSVPVRPSSVLPCPVSATVSSTPLISKAHSIAGVLEAGMTVFFQVILLDGCNRFIGMLIRDEGDMSIVEFDSLAQAIESVPGFQPSVGSVVAALSLADNQWYRGFITKVWNSSYTVLYVDYGNVEEGVTSVKPIPPSYRHLTLSVRLSVVENSALEFKKYVDETMVLDSSHQLEVTAKGTDGSVLAKITGENISLCGVKLEPWTSFLPKPDVAPVPIRNIAPPNWEAGLSCDVMPIIAEDIDCIYVQAVTDEIVELTSRIRTELNEYMPNSVSVSTVPVVGSYVAAVFPDDGELYRARIIATTGNSFTLFYLDFGNTSTVSLSGIRVLPDRFYDYPACCKRVSLARVARPPGPLPIAVQDLLSSSVNKIFKMHILSFTSEFTECVLTEDGEVLNELIADLFEQSDTGTCPPTQMPKLEAASPDRNHVPEADVPVDNTLSKTSYDDGPFLELPEGRDFQAVISYVNGPQLVMLRVEDDQISKKLVCLGEELEVYATAIVRGYGPKLNEICIARYGDDKWYRSACIDVIEDPAGRRYRCIQVDYGETHIVDVDDIRRIPKRLIDCLPYLAQHTILEGTESLVEVNPELVTRFGEILPRNSKKTVSVVSRVDIAYIIRIPEVSAILSSEGLL